MVCLGIMQEYNGSMNYTEFIQSSTECPFCHLKQEEILATSSAFLSYAIAPYHEHQLLVSPRRHTEEYLDLTQQEMEEIDSLLKKGVQILKHLGYKNYSILFREGEGYYKSVPHLHFNIIPCDLVGPLNHKGEERRVLECFETKNLLEALSKAKTSLGL